MRIENKTPLDFQDQLQLWNYHYADPSDKFFKYVGMGMMVLDNTWRLSFIIRGMNGKLLTHHSKEITESIEELPWAEAEIFKAYLQLPEPLMLWTSNS